jgi:phage repressor protein C with HTH and peptisase S24 domain
MQQRLNAAMDTIGARAKAARKLAGMSQIEAATASGVTQSDISKIERGETERPRGLLALARAYNVNPTWLDLGEGSPRGDVVLKEALTTGQTYSESSKNRDVVHISQYDAGGAMGQSLILQGDQPGIIRHMAVTQEWAQKNLRAHTGLQNLCIVTGFGDSMKPLYNPGDPLIIDQGVKQCDQDAVYFFRVGNEGFIKRLQRIPGEGIWVLSANKEYKDWLIKKDADFEVFGRVMKAWRGEDL